MTTNQFPFNQVGATDWRIALYAATQTVIDVEKQFIQTGFINWLPQRFQLSTDQFQYAVSLGPQAQQSIANSLITAIDNRANIVLVNDAQRKGQGNSKTANSTQSFVPDPEIPETSIMVLTFSFSYL